MRTAKQFSAGDVCRLAGYNKITRATKRRLLFLQPSAAMPGQNQTRVSPPPLYQPGMGCSRGLCGPFENMSDGAPSAPSGHVRRAVACLVVGLHLASSSLKSQLCPGICAVGSSLCAVFRELLSRSVSPFLGLAGCAFLFRSPVVPFLPFIYLLPLASPHEAYRISHIDIRPYTCCCRHRTTRRLHFPLPTRHSHVLCCLYLQSFLFYISAVTLSRSCRL